MTKTTELAELSSLSPNDLVYGVQNDGTPSEFGFKAKSLAKANLIGYRKLLGAATITTTSTTWTAIDGTGLSYITVDLEIGDTVWCYLQGSGAHSTTNYTKFDFEVDRPVSGNLILSETDQNVTINTGDGLFFCYGTGGQNFSGSYPFTATEAGVHGFRPVWRVPAGTGSLYNGATSTDFPVIFKVLWS